MDRYVLVFVFVLVVFFLPFLAHAFGVQLFVVMIAVCWGSVMPPLLRLSKLNDGSFCSCRTFVVHGDVVCFLPGVLLLACMSVMPFVQLKLHTYDMCHFCAQRCLEWHVC